MLAPCPSHSSIQRDTMSCVVGSRTCRAPTSRANSLRFEAISDTIMFSTSWALRQRMIARPIGPPPMTSTESVGLALEHSTARQATESGSMSAVLRSAMYVNHKLHTWYTCRLLEVKRHREVVRGIFHQELSVLQSRHHIQIFRRSHLNSSSSNSP